jgi:hypothetical protein
MLSFIVFAGAAIDQGVACILMLVALVLTYLIHWWFIELRHIHYFGCNVKSISFFFSFSMWDNIDIFSSKKNVWCVLIISICNLMRLEGICLSAFQKKILSYIYIYIIHLFLCLKIILKNKCFLFFISNYFFNFFISFWFFNIKKI